jgi:hypothetical protein
MFYTAQGIIRERSRKYTDKELLDLLKTLYQKHGFLSGLIINESEITPKTGVYSNRLEVYSGPMNSLDLNLSETFTISK